MYNILPSRLSGVIYRKISQDLKNLHLFKLLFIEVREYLIQLSCFVELSRARVSCFEPELRFHHLAELPAQCLQISRRARCLQSGLWLLPEHSRVLHVAIQNFNILWTLHQIMTEPLSRPGISHQSQ